MMIAQRFKAVGWVAGVASAGIGLYLISLQVAAERGRLERVERQIADTRHDIRSLQTEFGARASMRQLEKWNGEVLALSAPRAVQFLRSDVQLASFDPATLDPKYKQPKVVMASATVEPAKEPTPVTNSTVRYATYTKPDVTPVATKAAASAASTTAAEPLLRRASLDTSKPVKPIKTVVSAAPVAMTKPVPSPAPTEKPVKAKIAAATPAKSGATKAAPAPVMTKTGKAASAVVVRSPVAAMPGKPAKPAATASKAVTPAASKPAERKR